MTDWAPKGPRDYAITSRRKVFPLDGDSKNQDADIKSVVNADFSAEDSEDNDDIIQAVKSIDPYLHPKNQIILRALIKVNSLVRDVGSLKQYKIPEVEVEGEKIQNAVKPLTFKEGLHIAREMGPYLAPGTRKQVETLFNSINHISHLKNNMIKVQSAENTDNRIDYILEGIKPFVAFDKYSQIKQVVNVVKIFQATKNMSSDVDTQNEPENKEVQENEQLNDIIGLLDKFSSKKNEAE
ncbi:MAG: hypothetical protein ACOWWR_17490 [Eubacteriales bacterium]